MTTAEGSRDGSKERRTMTGTVGGDPGGRGRSRMKLWLGVLAALGLLAGACTAGETSAPVDTVDPNASNEPVTLEVTGEKEDAG